ncbi:alpha/beta hydrolase [Candidatus Sumerlaeota bacterium]|nr:alpha/beta hydrolase [Candidatus Sumerlaeota bacterium]
MTHFDRKKGKVKIMQGIIYGMSGALLFMSGYSRVEASIDKNIVYGMYSGLALLMDVHYPEAPNKCGILFVAGSGWQAPLTYNAQPLKEKTSQNDIWIPPLLRAGYTVFTINHRAAPRFHYPAALEDVQRAIRFIRFHAENYAIDPNRIGGVAGSSGAHLVCLAAMLGAQGVTDDPDPVNREPASLQCVVLRAAPIDMMDMATKADSEGIAYAVSFMEMFPSNAVPVAKIYADASPITHISSSSPPVLLIHGDTDKKVPFQQSVMMEKALHAVNVPGKLLTIPGGGHGPDFEAEGKPHPEWPDYLGETMRWLDRHLKPAPLRGKDKQS